MFLVVRLLLTSSAAPVTLFFLPPGTNEKTILHQRAIRIRRATGNPKFKSQYEMEKHKDDTVLKSFK